MLKNVEKVKVSISKPIKCLAVESDSKVFQEVHCHYFSYSFILQSHLEMCWYFNIGLN